MPVHDSLSNSFHVYVDFDSTLYDTAACKAQLFQVVADKTGLTPESIDADATAFNKDLILGGYAYEAHMTSYGLEPAGMWRELESIVHETDFLYPDSAAFIRALRRDGFQPVILSFGENRFQTIKIKSSLAALSGGGDSLDYKIVMQPKKFYLSEFHDGHRGVLVDDKPDQQLPEGFTEIHLHRAAHLNQPRREADRYVVSDLAQAHKVICRLA